MNRNINETTICPPARMPRGKRVPNPSALAGNQGGRARVRPLDDAGLVAVAAGWPVAFAAALAPVQADVVAALMVCAASLMCFGLGWIARGDGGAR